MDYEQIRFLAGLGGLIFFILLFAGVLVWVFRPGSKATYDRAAQIPLKDETSGKTRGKEG